MQEQTSAVTVRKTISSKWPQLARRVWAIRLLKNTHLSQLQGLSYWGKNKSLFSVQVRLRIINPSVWPKHQAKNYFVCVCWSSNFEQLSLDVDKISISQNGTESLTQKHSFSFWNCKTDSLSYFLGTILWATKNFSRGKSWAEGLWHCRKAPSAPDLLCSLWAHSPSRTSSWHPPPQGNDTFSTAQETVLDT